MGVKNHLINMIYLSIILGLIGTQYPVNAQISDLMIFYSFAMESYQTMDGIHDTVLKFETASTDDIMDKVAELSDTVDMWGNKIEKKLEEVNTFIRLLPLLQDITNDVRAFTKYFVRIDKLYEEFKQYVADPASFNNETVASLLKVFTSRDGDDLVATINALHALIVPTQFENYKKSVLLLLAQETQEYALDICDSGIPQYRLLDFHSIVATIEMRALTMISTGYLMKSLQKNSSYMGEIKRSDDEFMARAQSYLLLLQSAMAIASKQFRRCDPPEGYIRDESFYEFEKFLQAIVANERILSSAEFCENTCETVPQPTGLHPCSGLGCESSNPQCRGNMRNCQYLSDVKIKTCENKETEPRRFQWIRDDDNKLHPDDTSSCDNEIRHYKSAKIGAFWNCDVCRCLCVEDHLSSPSSHFINLREQLSDVANNRVIVGLQFSVVDRIAHVEILQGLLGPNGTIDEGEVEWIDLEEIHYDMAKSVESGSFKIYKYNEDGTSEEMIEDKDIAVLTYDSRRINLDKLSVPSEQLVTGIKFIRELDGDSTKPIHFEIQATPFDYKTGKLDIEKSVWLGPKDTSYVKGAEIRTQYVGGGGRNPEKSKKTKIDTKPNAFIDVTWSGWDEDASQTIIPLLDANPVYSEPMVPLSGVGIYHKKQEGYGGFLTFVVEGFDKSPYIVRKVSEKRRKNDRRRS